MDDASLRSSTAPVYPILSDSEIESDGHFVNNDAADSRDRSQPPRKSRRQPLIDKSPQELDRRVKKARAKDHKDQAQEQILSLYPAIEEQLNAPAEADEPAGEPSPESGPAPVAYAQPGGEQILEALLFSADAAIPASKLASFVGVSSDEVPVMVESLNRKYELAGLSFRVESIARGLQLMTLPQFNPWLSKLHADRSQTRLTDALLETLSIIAYKQPIIRAEVESIRGVSCGEALARLRDMGMIRQVGRAEIVGRPFLYGTTKKFLDQFGLADLNDLPPLTEFAPRVEAKNVATTQDEASPADKPGQSPESNP